MAFRTVDHNLYKLRDSSSQSSGSPALPPMDTLNPPGSPTSPHSPHMAQQPPQVSTSARTNYQKEPTMPPYLGPSSNSVKIKPNDRNFGYDGTKMTIDKFILRYEAVGRIDKATARDLAEQVTQFIKDLDVQEEVEGMSGYLEGNWK
ncbi:hypothetical protein Pst134EB_033301 [Puccinia striiformis f. sp. tritici]|nr:hypothetical protein Pst134EB_033301 [Puccinia striiformis f. sp. tritici]